MEEVFKNPVAFSKGINLSEIMTEGSEFEIDMDFKKKSSGALLNGDDDLFPDLGEEGDSDSEDVLKLIEDSTDKKMLASPEYHSFDELAKKMIDCEPRGHVKMLILEEGNDPLVPLDAEVTIHYAAYWEKASIPFDSTLTMNYGAPLRLRLGKGRLIPGLEVGLTSVKGPSARFMLLVQPDMGWGSLGVQPRIKPEPALFVIMLYEVNNVYSAHRFNDLPREIQSKFETTSVTVKSLHEEAKKLFNRKIYKKAISTYQQSISVINLSRPENEMEENEVKRLKINALINITLCYSKINKPKQMIRMLESLDYIIDIETNCKAMFYYGKANELLGKTDLAIEYYQKALKIEPKNRDIGKALENLDKYLKKSAKDEKHMWQSVFKGETTEKFNVDKDFEDGVKQMFEDLTASDEFAKFDLPPGLKQDEVDYVKHLAKDFAGMVVHEEGEGRRKKVTIVKKVI